MLTPAHVNMHKDFAMTFGAERRDRSQRCSEEEEESGRRVWEMQCWLLETTNTHNLSVKRWSIFILRFAKWGHSGGPAEYIPHLHHESSTTYYSWPAQGRLVFRTVQWGLWIPACSWAPVSTRARARSRAYGAERGDGYSPCDRQRAGCLMRKWMRGDIHWLPFTHSLSLSVPAAAQHSDLHWDEPAGSGYSQSPPLLQCPN